MTVLLEIAVGLVVGTVMGALGAGGAIITIPALIYLLGQSPQEATTTSLVIVGLTAVVGAAQHARGGRVRFVDGTAFAVLGFGGAVLGARLALVADPDVILVLFAALLVAVASIMWTRGRVRARTDPVEEPPPWFTWRPFHLDARRAGIVLVLASAVGVLTGFFGVGGGFAVVPALTIVLGLSMATGVGTSLLVIALTSAVSLAARLGGSDVRLDWALVAVFTGAAMLGSLAGSTLARRLPSGQLARAFAVLLVLVAGYTAVRALPAVL